ncbi:hypothetical protein GON26_12600 [Flavobacterium sp. GA093]|uniref:HEAT repeat-containing protein n=1 Tax=Flavobacterium hydrocarbonoxydans TaxID=2683249 RepID=A0A6I4NM99_9FLAO|nr:hypothetical protein [Flavobacterium hydrocarbonoxydans]MWB95203.1 hypothetical protein [Flavobacterium hydrocarbonoxydans]
MINFRELYKNSTWVEPFLILTISLFVTASFILYVMIIRSRNRNIRKERLRIEYSSLIEKLIFSIIFDDTPFSVIKEDKGYIKYANNPFFREVITETIMNLHKNYEGVYAQKLEKFYTESGLIKDSFKKLRNPKWEVKCKGITELAEINATKAFDTILTISKGRNKTLKITALNACIKLRGTKGIVHLTEHHYPIDDWTQINIINAFKKHDIGDTKGIELLLESQNSTVVTLGLKLIKELNLTQKIPYVTQLAARTTNSQLKYKAQDVLQTLTV